MPGRKIIFAFCLICFVSSGSRAQQSVPPPPKPAQGSGAPQPIPPPPKPAGDSPGLEVTMKFIQDKLNDIGPVKCTSVRIGTETPMREWTFQISNVVADPQRCTISYHSRFSFHDQLSADSDKPRNSDVAVNLKETQKIAVVSFEQHLNDGVEAGRTSTVRPPAFEVRLHQVKNNISYFAVDDEELANRLARAITHAVELCTPDKKPEPF